MYFALIYSSYYSFPDSIRLMNNETNAQGLQIYSYIVIVISYILSYIQLYKKQEQEQEETVLAVVWNAKRLVIKK